jgi:hypothetical protein
MNKTVGGGAMVLLVAGIALTVAAFRDTSHDSFFAPFKWFGPVLIGFGALLLLILYFFIRD